MGAKVSFDGVNKIINITQAPVMENGKLVVDLDIKTDVYSDGKEDWLSDSSLNKYKFPLRAIGGNNLPGSKQLGTTFFLDSNWKIRPYEASHTFRVNGNIYSPDGTSPFTETLGNYNIMLINSVSSLVDSTVQQLAEIQHGAYQNAVWIDVNSSNSGIDYPTGTREYPVNNTQDAVSIANNKGFGILKLLSDLTLDSGDNISDLIITTDTKLLKTLTINSAAQTNGAVFENIIVEGVLDGNSTIIDSYINDLDYINGIIVNSIIDGTITLAGSKKALLNNCSSAIEGSNYAIVDMGGSGQDLILRNFNGRIKVKNLSGANFVDATINGEMLIDTDVSAGAFLIFGTGKVVNNSTGTAFVDYDSMLNMDSIKNIEKITTNNVDNTNDIITIYEDDGVTVWRQYDLSDRGRVKL